jgi:hypothetical protein
MANYNPGNTTAVSGYSNTKPSEQVATSLFYEQKWPYVNNYNFVDSTATRPGWLTGRRPNRGQQYPRGIYNK